MYTYIIRENPVEDNVNLAFFKDNDVPRIMSDYTDAQSAIAANPSLKFVEVTDAMREEEDISADVLYIAED